MKRLFCAICLTAGLLYTTLSYPYGGITHIVQSQVVLDLAHRAGDTTIPSTIRNIITQSAATEKAFRSGALDGDTFWSASKVLTSRVRMRQG